MSGLVFGAVAPHGFTVIPAMCEPEAGPTYTRLAMEELGRRCASAQPDVLVVATPHGFRVDDAICLAAVSRAAGTLRWEGRTVEMHVPVDQRLTDGIAAAARSRGLPVAMASFAGYRREQSAIPLDWGVITPAWFLGYPWNMAGHGDVLESMPEPRGPSLVIVSPSRSLPREQLIEFGQAIAEAAEADGRRVALIASCDWSHTHTNDAGSYGFHPSALEVDGLVVEALQQGDLRRLMEISDEKAIDAAIDGLWQALILAGALQHTPMRAELLSYEVYTYYGMAVAAFEPE